MCARRFLLFIFIMTLLVVAGAFAIFQFGGSVLIKQATPYGHFTPPPADGAPDYADTASWLASPDAGEELTSWLPEGVEPPATRGDAAIFYVHPTTYMRRDHWNAPLHPDIATEERSRLFVKSQASAFNNAGDIWAPRYRQAAFGTFLLSSEDSHRALSLALGDVEKAFAQFLEEAGNRPIILAGHSQGSLLLTQLLQRDIAGKPVAKRILAVYLAGWPISKAGDLPALGLPACKSPDATGCIVNWMSFGDPANPNHILNSWRNEDGLVGTKRPADDLICVNPISGTVDGAAPPKDNPGTLVPDLNFKAAKLEPGRVGATCHDGLAIIDGDIPNLGSFVMPGNNYHVYDYALFWGAIRRDAERRLAAWPR